jgi:hypothetical protein
MRKKLEGLPNSTGNEWQLPYPHFIHECIGHCQPAGSGITCQVLIVITVTFLSRRKVTLFLVAQNPRNIYNGAKQVQKKQIEP